jgi:hypothetical protein
MADNVSITQGAGTTIATDDVSGVHFQKVKIAVGGDGVATDLLLGVQANAASLSVTPSSDHGPFKTKPVTSAHDIEVTFTRPNNQTPYTAGDVVGASPAAMTFAGVGANGETVMITGAQLEIDVGSVPSGMTTFRLHLYSVTPPSALVDNAAFDLASGDRASYRGFIDFPTIADLGSTLYCEVNNLTKQIKLGTSSLFGYLATIGAFTPGAVSEVYKVTLHTLEI